MCQRSISTTTIPAHPLASKPASQHQPAPAAGRARHTPFSACLAGRFARFTSNLRKRADNVNRRGERGRRGRGGERGTGDRCGRGKCREGENGLVFFCVCLPALVKESFFSFGGRFIGPQRRIINTWLSGWPGLADAKAISFSRLHSALRRRRAPFASPRAGPPRRTSAGNERTNGSLSVHENF